MGSWAKISRTDDKLTIKSRRRNGIYEEPPISCRIINESNEKSTRSKSSRKSVDESVEREDRTRETMHNSSTSSNLTDNEKEKFIDEVVDAVVKRIKFQRKNKKKDSKNGRNRQNVDRLLTQLIPIKRENEEILRNSENVDKNRDDDKRLREIEERNRFLRNKYEINWKRSKTSLPNKSIRSSLSNKSIKSSLSNKSIKSSDTSKKSAPSSSYSDETGSSMSFSNAKQMMEEIGEKRKKASTINEMVDHKGIPLSHPLATTPFPGASTSAQREKARQLLRSLGTRKDFMESSEKKRSSSKKSGKASAKNRNKSESSTTRSESSRKLSSKNDSDGFSKYSKRKYCSHCGTCLSCAKKCSDEHTDNGPCVSENDKKHFIKSIKKLKKQIQNPEKKRHFTKKSPFDCTQSASECSKSESGHREKEN